LNILVLTSSYPSEDGDPSGHFVHTEVQALRGAGHSVTVLYAGPRRVPSLDPPTVAAEVALGGDELFGSPGAWPRLVQDPRRIRGLLRASCRVLRERRSLATRPPPQRIIAHWLFPAGLLWALLLRRPGVDLEIVLHGSDLRLLLLAPAWLRHALLLHLKRRAARFRLVSHAMRAELLAAAPRSLSTWLEEARVEASPIRVDVTHSQAQAREVLQLDPQSRVLLMVGRMIEQKRLAVAIRAALLVPSAAVYVVGEGPLATALHAAFPEVTFLGPLPRDRTLLWIRAADALINASRLEGAPTTIREALLLDTIAVSPLLGDLDEWSRHSERLWCVR